MKKIFFVLFLLSFQLHAQLPTTKVMSFQENLIFDLPSVRDLAMSKKGDEIYFTVQGYQGELSTIVYSKFIQGKWNTLAIASFSGKYDDLEPFLSNDELRLYFASNRPTNVSTDTLVDFDIWYVERKSIHDPWLRPINMGAPVNTSQDEFYPCITLSGNLYFTGGGEGTKGKDDIFMSEWVNGKFTVPVSLDTTINSEGYEFNAFIAPDESYLLFTGYNRTGGQGSGDLFISKKMEDGKWGQAESLGTEINSKQMDYCPFVNTTTNELFFTSKRNSLGARKNEFKNLNQLLKEMNSFSNGLSRLYRTPFSID
ncbi:MAG: PD40 domain-containing protein [Bacteroidetes bacterium]|nr:PD40 domain-containing protein [Bacteroidota bacterium]